MSGRYKRRVDKESDTQRTSNDMMVRDDEIDAHERIPITVVFLSIDGGLSAVGWLVGR